MKHTGFQLEHCRPDCPQLARNWHDLYEALTMNLTSLNLYQTLEDKYSPVLNHHIPKICLAGCPNGCSLPNIKDFGISGYVTPRITDALCIECNECVRSCLEKAITLIKSDGIAIDHSRCLSCGNCQRVCPSGKLEKVVGHCVWVVGWGDTLTLQNLLGKFRRMRRC